MSVNISSAFPLLMADSVDSVKFFKMMATYGFLSTESQEGMVEKTNKFPSDSFLYDQAITEVAEQRQANNFKNSQKLSFEQQCDKKYMQLFSKAHHGDGKNAFIDHGFERRERAYITGFVFKPLALNFFVQMNMTDYVAFAVAPRSKPKNKKSNSNSIDRSINNCSRIPFTYQLSSISFPWSSDGVVLQPGMPPPSTLGHLTYTKQEIKTTFQRDISEDQRKWFAESFPGLKGNIFNVKNWVFFECFDPVYGRIASNPGGLFEHVLSSLKYATNVYAHHLMNKN